MPDYCGCLGTRAECHQIKAQATAAIVCHAVGRRWETALLAYAFGTWTKLVELTQQEVLVASSKDRLLTTQQQAFRRDLGLTLLRRAGRRITREYLTYATELWIAFVRAKKLYSVHAHAEHKFHGNMTFCLKVVASLIRAHLLH